MAVIEVTNETFQKEVVESDIPVIIDFFAPWCGPCRMMAPVFEEISAEYDGKLKFVKLNTQDYPESASKFNITGIPCLVVAKKGEEFDRIVGFAPGPVMKQQIDAIMSKI